MSRLESVKRLLRRWLWSISFFVLLGLVLGALISIPLISKPNIAIITISAPYLDQAQESKVLAIYDLTLMTEPYNGILDNNQLIANIADWLANSSRRP